jgi:hypothetical protein
MSSAPPPPGSLPPPPPPPFAAVRSGSLPWESGAIGLDSFVETAKLFITAPSEAWSRTPEKGDLLKPLLFSVILGWVGIIFSSVYGMFITASWMNMMPPQYRRYMGGLGVLGAGSTILRMVLAPIFIAIALFIGAAIYHLCFMIVGALSSSTSGFEGTFRVIAYSGVSSIAYVVPFVGGLLALVWRIVLMVMGAVALHRTTQGKAVAGVLIPLVLCCGCIALAIVFGAAALMSTFHR